MAVDIFFYSSLPVHEVRQRMDHLKERHPGLFCERFIISVVRESSDFGKEIGFENGLITNSQFMIGLNDKSVADLVQTVIILVRQALGEENFIAMSDGSLRKA